MNPLHRRLCVFPLLCCVLPAVLAQPGYLDVGADYLYESNIGRAEHSHDVLSDNIAAFSAAYNLPYPLGERSGLLNTARLDYARHADQEDLSEFDASLGSQWRYKPGAAFTAPWLEASARAAVMQFQDSDIRDGASLRVGADIGRNFTDRLIARIGYRYEWRHAWDADVFNLSNHRLAGSFDLTLSDRLALYGSVGWQIGDLVSTATPSPAILNISEARALDTALSDRAPGALRVGNYYQGDRVAYRLEGQTLTGEIGINYALSRTLALDLSVLRFDAAGDGDNDYHGYQARAGLLYRF
ncbi:MAG: hypothetical protein U1F34_00360 [Gammaproteobacteria bacterium]